MPCALACGKTRRMKFAILIVWTTEENDPAAKLVAQALGRRTPVEVTKTDLGPGIDVIVGNRFKRVDRKAPRRIRLADPVEKCVPVD